ncbi:cation diffusion facilitator family transporter [Pseudoalteromonas sp. CnMc7-15]|uniref:cation diffusion facilitator family transporter n=1 Tax=Pseudoalteromonas TaxID=53246 RepID=UPI001EF3D68C|nr:MULTISPECIES: cation diffusion facilitator family transporter [Pseudoalteromonas]MCG7567111.1 cation diffusion facilitator family transporter [Pseudoalteromonas sp. CnMc7-15]MCG7570766.1 cation diffusion facilitator family transporter [Pseudoalteromonas sp. CNC9-20]|tara:strand:+ start:4405 stop:5286 length:882 start_codon:yes stop_codon:yes gene_type:complete
MAHHHDHSHDIASERIGWAFFLNLGFTIIEFIGGWLTNSTAIMADAVHDLGDSLSIGSAWLLNKFSNKGANQHFTYGYRRLSLFGAFINSVVLVIGSVWVLVLSVPRLFDPVMPVTEGMLALAVLGIAVNGYAAIKLSSGKSLNEKVLNWHLLEDVLGWVAVLVVAIVLMFVDWPILDPILSICFTLFILINVVRNLVQTVRLFLQGAPDKKTQTKLTEVLIEPQEISTAHHVHYWSLDGEHHVLTAHLCLAQELNAEQVIALKQRLADNLAEYDLAHTTLEFEYPQEQCRDG